MASITQVVLELNLGDLSEQEIAWLHELKNVAQKITWSQQLNEIRAKREVLP